MKDKRIDIQGHRGARGLYPENTIISFVEAVKLSVDTLEMDVVISKDEQVVVSHEPWMNHLFCSDPDGKPIEKEAEQSFNLYNMSYAEIMQFDCGRRGNSEFPSQKAIPAHKPLLSEVIEKTEAFTKNHSLPPVKYNIEIKSEQQYDGIFNPVPKLYVDLVYNEIKKFTIFPRIILQSFDVRILQELRKKDPALTISFLVENKESLETNLACLGFTPAIFTPEFILIDQLLVDQLHEKNIRLFTWTVNEIEDMNRLAAMGVDGIISDYPDRAVALLKNKNK